MAYIKRFNIDRFLMKALLILSCFTCVHPLDGICQDQSKNLRTIVDTSKIALLPYDSTNYWIFQKVKPAQLNHQELENIEVILREFIHTHKIEQEKSLQRLKTRYPKERFEKKKFVIDLENYKRQYIAVTNHRGEKEGWLNIFCSHLGSNWKTDLVMVLDGGNCFFNLKINLTTGNYYDVMINGEA